MVLKALATQHFFLLNRLLFEKIESLHKTRVIPADVDAFMEPRLDYQLDSVESALQKLSEQFQRFRENNSVLIAEKNTAVKHTVALAKICFLLCQ